MAETFSRQLMYDMYIRGVILRVLSRHSSIYRTFTKRAVAKAVFNVHPLQNHVLRVRLVLFRMGVSLFFIYLAHFYERKNCRDFLPSTHVLSLSRLIAEHLIFNNHGKKINVENCTVWLLHKCSLCDILYISPY